MQACLHSVPTTKSLLHLGFNLHAAAIDSFLSLLPQVDLPIKLVNDDVAPGVRKGGWMAINRCASGPPGLMLVPALSWLQSPTVPAHVHADIAAGSSFVLQAARSRQDD